MKLSLSERQLFGKLYSHLMQFGWEKSRYKARGQHDQEAFIAIRDSLFQNRRLLTTFVTRNPFDFSPEELEIVSNWKQAHCGWFYIVRDTKDYTVFVECRKEYEPSGDIFGVVALDKPFKKIVQTPLPVLVRTVLLPFRGRIIFDGAMTFHSVDLGDDVRQTLDGVCDYKSRTSGVITSLEVKHERNLGTQSKTLAKRKVPTHTKKPKSK